MAEGFLTITGVTQTSQLGAGAHAGETVNFTVHTQNTGADDNFRVELTGDLIDAVEFSLATRLIKDLPFSFVMPDKNVSIIINTFHLEGGTWIWDVSSRWDIDAWN